MKNFIKYFLVLLIIAGISGACDTFLSPSVDQNKPTTSAIQSASDMQAVVYGAYDDLNRVELYGRDYMVSLDVMTDNALSNGNSGRFVDQDNFNFTVNSGYAQGVWQYFYQVIADANIAINSELASSSEVDKWRGEAYAIRAFAHMNLLLAFGQEYVSGGDPNKGVPYVTTYNEGDFYPSRDPIADVWTKVGEDLQSAAGLLQPSDNTSIELDYWGLKALQTRYYLYTKQYDQVVTTAEEIIDSGNFSITPAADLVKVWQSGSGPVSLFELAFTTTDRLGTDNIARIYRDTNYGDVEATADLYNAHASDDVRLDLYSANGGTYRMVNKYSDELGSDNVRVLRYAEVVLNYAEALANGASGEMSTTEALNMLASKRYQNGSPYSVTNPATLNDVLYERRLELAMEGHRLYDLARTGRDIPAVAGDGSGPISYGDYRFALPIPDAEIRANSNVTQNKGYE